MKKAVKVLTLFTVIILIFLLASCRYFDPMGGVDEIIEWSDSFTAYFTNGEGAVIDDENDIGDYSCIAVYGEYVYIVYGSCLSANGLKIARSGDYGETWEIGRIISDGTNVVLISMTVDEGDIYIAYANGGNTEFAKSETHGDLWEMVRIDHINGTGDSYTSILANSGNVYISYTVQLDLMGNFDLKFARSPDGGDSWNSWIVDADSNGSGSSLAISGNILYICYASGILSASRDVRLASSNDNGENWNIQTLLTDWDAKCNSIAAESNEIYLSFTTSYLGPYFCRYNGSSWDILGQDIDSEDIDAVMNDMVLDNGRLYVSYYTEDGTLRLAVSEDRGTSWTTQTVDYSTADGGADGRLTSLAVDGDTIYISYKDSGDGGLKISKSIDGGNTFLGD
jgi:hypothetical protein